MDPRPQAGAHPTSDDRGGWIYGPEVDFFLTLPLTGLPATVDTYLATDWIWVLDRLDPNAGIPPPPLVTWCTTSASDGLSWSRFGPTVPVDPAAASVWQEAHVDSNTVWPALRLTAVEDPPVAEVLALVVEDEVVAAVVEVELLVIVDVAPPLVLPVGSL